MATLFPSKTSRPTVPEESKFTSWRLHGSILSSDGFIKDGTLVIENGKITEVLTTRSPATNGTPEFDASTHLGSALIVPGMVDLHNHPAWNIYPQWTPTAKMRSRFDWRGKNRCGVWINPNFQPFYRDNISPSFKYITEKEGQTKSERIHILASLVLYGQLRGLIGGATTMVVDADIDPDDKDLESLLGSLIHVENGGPARRVWGVLDVPCLQPSADESNCLLTRIKTDVTRGDGCLLVHVAEGVDDQSRGEFWTLRDRGLLTKNTALIHALGLTYTDWRLVAERESSVVWSPTSNVRLYGRSLDIASVASLGIRICLAPDWSITGGSSPIDELIYVRDNYKGIFKPKQLWDMVTRNPGSILTGKENTLGVIAPGAIADLLLIQLPSIPRNEEEAYELLIQSASVNTVAGAMVAGRPVYGVDAFMAQLQPESEHISFSGEDDVKLERRLAFTSPVVESYGKLEVQLAEEMAQSTGNRLKLAPLWEPLNLS